MTDVSAHYLEEVARQFRGHKRVAEAAMIQVSDENLFHILDGESNSIAILVKHMAGNMRSRFTDFLTTDGEKPDRYRDQEFEIAGLSNRADVMQCWEKGWTLVFDMLSSIGPADITKTVTIRGEPHSVLQALNRALTHYAYHVGQIVMLCKHLRKQDWNTLSVAKGKSEEYNRVEFAKAGQKQ